jgi:hypothetical protein
VTADADEAVLKKVLQNFFISFSRLAQKGE